MVRLKKYLYAQPTLIVVLLSVCVTGYGLRVYELVGPVFSAPATGPDSAPGSMATMPTEMMPARAVAELNLFGEAGQVIDITASAELSNVPKTKLDLTLNAVFAETTQADASAVVATQNNSVAKRYFIYETLPGNALLYAIYPDHVILKRGGRLEKLVFPRDKPE